MKIRLASLVLVLALLSQFATFAAPATVRAQQANPFRGIPVTGTTSNGVFSGTLNIVNFAVQNAQLVANGTLSGTLKDAAGNTIGTLTNAPVSLPLAQQQSSGGCTILHLELGPLDLNLLGLVIHLNRVVLDITAQPGPGNLLGNLLCSIANLLNQPGGLTTLAGLLNSVLGLLNAGTLAAGNPLQGIPIAGTLPGGTFSGLLNITGFVDNAGKLFANGTLTGALSSGGTVQPIASPVAVSFPLTVSGVGGPAASPAACQILHLDLAPITLNLLGLQVTTNEIVLDITAQPGPGNLLGNLLCAIVNLLNGPDLTQLTNLLNGLASILNMLQSAQLSPFNAIPVAGAAAQPPGGTLAGLLNLTGFATNQAGQLVANGTLVGLVSDAAGQVTGVATQSVSLPVSTPVAGARGATVTATCTILHLVLGPINLNLLGLVITTNQIVLDITAQSGPGNLLGNLLCAIANLLNPPGPLATLADLLNAVIAAFNSPLSAILNPFQGIPVTGTVAGAAGAQPNAASSFAGLLTISSFAVDGGQLMAHGILSGVVSDGTRTGRVIPQEVALPVVTQSSTGTAHTTATCTILHLVLGPINLNLLGLVITTNQIVLDITAQSGPGNLLGNLLCAIANLLNPGGTLGGLATLLNSLLVAFNSTLGTANPFRGIPVTGAAAGAAARARPSATPSFVGLLDITRFAVQNGQLVALGTLTGTLVDANGVSHAISQAVTIPINAAGTTGTCQILHLELGPLDLNLLGLVIHLDKVVLDITAQSGPGNLLGNLLCAIANLLNPQSSLTLLASLLNLLVDLFNGFGPVTRVFLPLIMR